jgi:hypothetical protein
MVKNINFKLIEIKTRSTRTYSNILAKNTLSGIILQSLWIVIKGI